MSYSFLSIFFYILFEDILGATSSRATRLSPSGKLSTQLPGSDCDRVKDKGLGLNGFARLMTAFFRLHRTAATSRPQGSEY